MTKRILITGSRDWQSAEEIYLAIFNWVKDNCPYQEEILIVHGDASRGADRMARDIARNVVWAEEEPHAANWEQLGKRAGFVRNQEMVDLGADVVLAFIRNGSKGATHTADRAEEAGLPVIRYIDNDADSV